MTAVTDAKLVVETVLGHTILADALTRIADAYMAADPHSLVATGDIVPVDPENPTNEEKAELFLMTLKMGGQHIVGYVSDLNSDDAAAATKAANRAAAIANME